MGNKNGNSLNFLMGNEIFVFIYLLLFGDLFFNVAVKFMRENRIHWGWHTRDETQPMIHLCNFSCFLFSALLVLFFFFLVPLYALLLLCTIWYYLYVLLGRHEDIPVYEFISFLILISSADFNFYFYIFQTQFMVDQLLDLHNQVCVSYSFLQ